MNFRKTEVWTFLFTLSLFSLHSHQPRKKQRLAVPMVHSSSASIDGQEKTDHYSLSVDANRVPFVRIDTFVNLLQNVERVEVGVNACLIACIINLNHWWEVSHIHVTACSTQQPIKLPALNSYVFSETERLILMKSFWLAWNNVISICAVEFGPFSVSVAGEWIYIPQ